MDTQNTEKDESQAIVAAGSMPPEKPVRGKRTPIGKSEQALASSANARINVSIDLTKWKHLTQDVQDELLWFHQHILDKQMSWEDVRKAVNLTHSTIYRCLKGTYEGSYDNVSANIRSYRRVLDSRKSITMGDFAETPVTKMIWTGLDYALTTSSITLIIGESGHGKSLAAAKWRDAHNHGRSVLVEAPPLGGTRDFLRVICEANGNNKNTSVSQMREALIRGFSPQRILIVDEAHRLIPRDGRTAPERIDFLRYIHDRTGCALALIATKRFREDMERSNYMFEQVLGRIGLPIKLPRQLEEEDILPIVEQYYREPSAKLIDACLAMANDAFPGLQGRIRLMHHVLKFSTRVAASKQQPLAEEHFFAALKTREKMMGELYYAKK